METLKFVYYQENDTWVGWLEEYPDYRSQGKDLDELKENLKISTKTSIPERFLTFGGMGNSQLDEKERAHQDN